MSSSFFLHCYQEHGKNIKPEFLFWSPKQQTRAAYYFSTQLKFNVQLGHLLPHHVSPNSSNLIQIPHSTVIQIKLLPLKSYWAMKCVCRSTSEESKTDRPRFYQPWVSASETVKKWFYYLLFYKYCVNNLSCKATTFSKRS